MLKLPILYKFTELFDWHGDHFDFFPGLQPLLSHCQIFCSEEMNDLIRGAE
ncbi:MAG TPA: hypothetical protein VE009_14825 [Paenibacillus sp.]|nr:hypothetical protein [Paenibacillus sp.]HZG86165.1 hypothetical protein [Paenibacillus sp.]